MELSTKLYGWTVVLTAIFVGVANGSPPPSSDSLTENSASQWGAAAQSASASVHDDAIRVQVGARSLRFVTNGGFDTWLWAPIARNAGWDLRYVAALRFWVYADNPSPFDFQNQSPWVLLGTGPGTSNYWQYQTPFEALNAAVGNWVELVIPLAGDATWQRTVAGAPNLADIDYVEIHADTWDSGFTLWFDGMTFDPTPLNPTGVAAIAGDSVITVTWNTYLPRPEFDHFAIYRDTVAFSSVAGQVPIATITNGNMTSHDDAAVVNGTAYYYAVTAVAMDGTEDTAVESVGPRIPGPLGQVHVTPLYSTAHVTWDPVINPDLAGYVVYRRMDGAPYSMAPTKRVLVRTSFSDYALSPGETYYYKVAAIDGEGRQITAFTDEQPTTLASGATGLSAHKNFELLMAFYTGGFSDDEVMRLTAGLQKGIEFYWRTSCGRLNMDVTWLYIDEETPGTGTGWDNPLLQNDLRARGVENDQYDLAYLVGADLAGCFGGYVIFGNTCAALGTVCGVPYPDNDPDIDFTIAWSFTHEIHHALEAMENISGAASPEVLFCHFPWAYPDPLGPTGWHMDWAAHFDGIAQTNRVYDDQWMLFPSPFDGYIECVDADGDGLPDDDARVPLDETRFGSSSLAADTDSDGLNDLNEFCAYNFRSTDPLDFDTDDDGLLDGDDHRPLYRVGRFLPLVDPAPTINGLLAIDENWRMPIEGYYFTHGSPSLSLNSYVAFDSDDLFFAFEADRPLRFKISIDASGQDGRFESPVRHVACATDTYNHDNKGNHCGDSWGDGNHIYASYGSNQVGVFGRSLIAGAQAASSQSGGTYTTEIRIPRVLPAGAAYTWYPPDAPTTDGLTLNPGHIMGLNITCSELPGSDDSEFSGNWTSVFETHSYVDFTLQLAGDADVDGDFDMRDFISLQECFGHSVIGCRAVDMNSDNAINLDDHAEFLLLMTGPQ